MKLSELEKGQRAIVESVDLEDSVKRRFSSMGLSRGIILKVCRRTLRNDSLHVKIECSACIALSTSEARHIKVTKIGSPKGLGYCNRRGIGLDDDCCKMDQ